MRSLAALLLSAVVLLGGSAPAALAQSPSPGPTALPPTGAPQILPLTAGQVSTRLSHQVFGFLPYWEIDAKTDAYLQYRLLSTIAFFGVPIKPDGTLNTGSPGYTAYMSATATSIIQHAHANGVRTVITFESFGTSHNAAFFGSAAAQATFIQRAVALMRQRGADGANIDVEEISGTYFAAFGQFLGAFRQAVLAWNPAAVVSADTNGATSGARMAAAAVANGIDSVFLMGYGFNPTGGDPVGNIAPLESVDGSAHSLSGAVDLYRSYGVPADRIILGLPYYGTTWPTTSGAPHATPQSDAATFGGAVTFLPSSLPGSASAATPGYDPVEQSAWFRRYDASLGTWFETYYDNPQSLAAKYRYAIQQGLAGVGIWALGYDEGQAGYWEALALAFVYPQITHLYLTSNPTHSLTVHLRMAGSGSPRVLGVRLSANGTTWGDRWAPGTTPTWTLPSGPDGPTAVYVLPQLFGGSPGVAIPVPVVLDRHAPVFGPLRLDWSAGGATWVLTFRATDLTGVARYEVRYRVNGGAWRTLYRDPSGTTIRFGLPRSTHLFVQVRALDRAGLWSAWRTVSVG